jgi:polysaccharide biosynthesis transport protein
MPVGRAVNERFELDSQARELTLRDLLSIYQRRKRIVLTIMFSLFALAVIYCSVCTRRYEASAVVQLQKEGSDAMGLDSIMSSAAGGASDALNANIDLQTQANILQSDTLALRTIDALHMEGTHDFQQHFSPIGWVMGRFSISKPIEIPGASLEDSPVRRQNAVKTFSKNLKVKPISGTRLIEIAYVNPDPKLAASVVNALTQELSDYTFQTRFDATKAASKWLGDQMGDLRKTSEDLQARVVNLQRESGVYSLGSADAQGREQAYSGVLDRLQQATAALGVAQQNRILKGAIAHAAENGDADMLSGLAGNGMISSSQASNGSLSLLQGLRQQEATQQAALLEAEAKFGSAYPKLAELRGSVAGLEHSIQQEVGRIRERAKSDYAVAVQTESNTRAQYNDAKRQADVLNNRAIDYTIAREEAQQSRSLYDDLFKKLNEAGVLSGLQSSNFTVVDPGRVPARPIKPNVPLYLMAAICAGLVLGTCSALLVDILDNKVNNVSDVEGLFGQTAMGVLPQVANEKEGILLLDDPESTYVEALRALRTGVLLSQSGAPPKTILVTSSLASEGKSTSAINLAVALAQTGRKTLLIDTDLRRGTLRRRMHLAKPDGLSNLLAGQVPTPEIQSLKQVPNLNVIVAGSKTPNPSELLGSQAMQDWLESWKSEYDFIVLDSAPVLPVTDSVTLNTLVDVTLLLSRVGVTEKPQVARSFNMLTRGGKHFVGLVLNGLHMGDSFYGYYGYRKHAYPYKGEMADAA